MKDLTEYNVELMIGGARRVFAEVRFEEGSRYKIIPNAEWHRLRALAVEMIRTSSEPITVAEFYFLRNAANVPCAPGFPGDREALTEGESKDIRDLLKLITPRTARSLRGKT